MVESSSPIQVLIVDDEPSICLLLRRWVERGIGAEVSEASDGLKALEKVAEGRTDMIITDLNMPVLNGTDMLTLLQADPRRRQMEVLVATQVAGEKEVRDAIRLGVSDYLLKPLQYDWVMRRVRAAANRVLERRKLQGDGEDTALPRILIADPDLNFIHTAEAAFTGRFAVQSSDTVAQTLVHTLRFKPDVILISADLPGFKIDFFLDRVRALPGRESPKVFQLLEPGSSEVHPSVVGGVQRAFFFFFFFQMCCIYNQNANKAITLRIFIRTKNCRSSTTVFGGR